MMYEGLNWVITNAWNFKSNGSVRKEWKGVNVEEVMTFLEVGKNMSQPDSDEYLMYENAYESLIDYLFPQMPMICRDQHCEHLMTVFGKLKDNDSIISYNWDTIAEFTLQARAWGRRGELAQLRNYAKLLRDNSIDIDTYRHKGLLLKLHGSFNWMACKNKNCNNLNKIIPPFYEGKKKYKLVSLLKNWKCAECQDKKGMKPFIVPPVSDKKIHQNSFVQSQWMIARAKLLDVRELIFIGYSFPPTDFYTEWLFRQLNFMDRKSPVEVTVVNPEYKRGSLVFKRYNRIFKDSKITSFRTLEEYAKN